MDMQDIKIAFINFLTFTISFSNVEQWLKLTLLIVSIVYTIQKIFELKNKKKDE
jgi:uncharacterized protein (DUF779 family)